MASKRQYQHYFSVFIDRPGEPDLAWFGYSERIAAWQFYRAIKAAGRTPGAYAVDLRQDGRNVASVEVKTVARA